VTIKPRPSTLQAAQLADGTYVVRSAQCCRPEACAPAVGARCCLSPRCDCPIPARWLQDPQKSPQMDSQRVPGARVGMVALYTGGGALCLGALAGIGLGVAQAVAWVTAHAVVLLGAGAVIAVPVVLALRASGSGAGRTFSGTFTGRMH
jgi:hypothetical protein